MAGGDVTANQIDVMAPSIRRNQKGHGGGRPGIPLAETDTRILYTLDAARYTAYPALSPPV
jgi:hypothetical protein